MSSLSLSGLDVCRRCPRLVACMAQLPPRKGLTRNDYHNAPVNGFGDLKARVCLVGLAPGAHGANRTGRPFTGDGAGDFMYPLLYRCGLSSREHAVSADDGLELQDLYITNAVKCLPPENRPNTNEFEACRSYLEKELHLLTNLQVIIALGHGAHISLLRLFQAQGLVKRICDVPFGHGSRYRLASGIWLIGCYHTSRYNVQTGRIDDKMFLTLIDQTRSLCQ
jgi:uracil-DNA glycosylase family 4